MSEPRHALLAGATGLVGSQVLEASQRLAWLRLVSLARRDVPMPRGCAVETRVADPAAWPQAVAAIAPEAVICALGTTMRQAGSEEAFRAVDHDLVLTLARAARQAGARNFVLVSSASADPDGGTFYLRVKGETEAALNAIGFARLDILRPGLLRGPRGGKRRVLERLAILASPLTDALLRGTWRGYRSIEARVVAAAALQALREPAPGHFVHDNDAIGRLASRLGAT